MKRIVIAITGYAGSGKSTAAKFLYESHGYRRVRFADPLKNMLRTFGLNEEEIEGTLKEKPSSKLGGKTPRYAMQTIGAQWGREMIYDDIWVDAWERVVRRVPEGINVVTEDCRYPNEAAKVLGMGGLIIKLTRVGAGANGGIAQHSSEALIDGLPVNVSIENNGSIETLHEGLNNLHARACNRNFWEQTLGRSFPL